MLVPGVKRPAVPRAAMLCWMPMRSARLLVLVVLLAGCGRDIDPPRPDRSTIRPATYAAVMSELMVARAELLPDSAAYGERQAEILARHGVTAAQIRAFADAYGHNEDIMLAVYRLARARLDTLFGPPGGAAPSGIVPPAEIPPAPFPTDTAP